MTAELTGGIELPATYLQQGLWPTLRRAHPAAASRVRAIRLTGAVELDRLARAVLAVCAELPGLSTRLIDHGDRLALERRAAPPVAVHDVGDVDAAGRDLATVALLRAERDRSVDVGRDPLVRFLLVRGGADEVVLGLVAHSLVLDERSVYLVLGAVMEAYRGRLRTGGYHDFTRLLGVPPLPEATAAARRRWWSAWLAALPEAERDVEARTGELRRMAVPAAQWRSLAAAGGTLRDNGSLGVAALAGWWLQRHGGRPVGAGLATVLDLRDYLELGTMVGPLTDRMVFRIEPTGSAAPSFRELFRKAQVGVLRAAAHYLPYGDVVDLAVGLGRVRPPRTAALWDVAVHLCRNPVAGPSKRDEDTSGVRVAHFREADLIGAGVDTPAEHWDGTNVDLHLSELDSEMALVVDGNRGCNAFSTDELVDGLSRCIEAAAADPDAPLT